MPSNYVNGRVPMLNLQVGVIYIIETLNKDGTTKAKKESPKLVAERELSADEIQYEQIKFEFFHKSMATKTMLRADSVMPEKI